MDFSWLAEIFNGLLSFIPRPVIVRATHGGIKWRWGSRVIELKPGWRWLWPLTTDYEIIVVARQTHKIRKPQIVESADGVTLAVGWVVVYCINDIVKAIGQRNWNTDTTINDITQSTITHVFNKYKYEYIQKHLCAKIEEELTSICKKELNKYGVLIYQVKITDFAKVEAKMLWGMNGNYIEEEEE